VREYSVPATLRVADDETLVDAVYLNAAQDEAAVAYRRRGADRQWREVTAGAFAAEVTAVARGLIAAGVQPGDRVALLSRTRYEWTLIDYAILAVGAATVPIYETSAAEQIRWILSDSGAVAIIVETAKHAALVDQVRGELGELKVWRIEPEDNEPGAVDRLVARGADVPEEAVLERRRAVRADDLATLIYTSGTTGRPKGCELTHRNMQT
jgi:long-chain acyl-CoA synthetase